MEPLRATFERLRQARRKALIPFIMGGDPDLVATRQLLLALEEGGADLIEVGIPFSDPLADGPVIQAASARALAQGATPRRVLEAIASVRSKLRVPIVCLSYWNPIMQFGGDGLQASIRTFVRAARASGISGLIVPDLPVEESARLRAAARRERFATILLAAPTSPPKRLRMIARASEGFIYYVSVTGTTGARRSVPSGLAHGIRQLRLLTTKPICVGFGISTPAQARTIARLADGVIVGSALIQSISQAPTRVAMRRCATTYLKRLKRAMA